VHAGHGHTQSWVVSRTTRCQVEGGAIAMCRLRMIMGGRTTGIAIGTPQHAGRPGAMASASQRQQGRPVERPMCILGAWHPPATPTAHPPHNAQRTGGVWWLEGNAHPDAWRWLGRWVGGWSSPRASQSTGCWMCAAMLCSPAHDHTALWDTGSSQPWPAEMLAANPRPTRHPDTAAAPLLQRGVRCAASPAGWLHGSFEESLRRV
jgi:hypothetical protein